MVDGEGPGERMTRTQPKPTDQVTRLRARQAVLDAANKMVRIEHLEVLSTDWMELRRLVIAARALGVLEEK
jgi:hypothetical protein